LLPETILCDCCGLKKSFTMFAAVVDVGSKQVCNDCITREDDDVQEKIASPKDIQLQRDAWSMLMKKESFIEATQECSEVGSNEPVLEDKNHFGKPTHMNNHIIDANMNQRMHMNTVGI
jgi:hypothetical protein